MATYFLVQSLGHFHHGQTICGANETDVHWSPIRKEVIVGPQIWSEHVKYDDAFVFIIVVDRIDLHGEATIEERLTRRFHGLQLR